ncbi:calcium, potassium:sodium antiporter [Aureococcus anophagefferens]|nr:calcium, potassium:sodium antiporter [Aureococcus anophagefferens]
MISPGAEIMLLAAASGVLFWAMAVVTEYRFVPSIILLSERLRIPKDVAGATLVAAGASSPELFSNVIAMFITKSDLGIGTIIGSEIFNHMMILAGVCASRTTPQRLDRLTTIRDNFAYAAALGLLLAAVADVRRHGYADDDGRDDNSMVVVHAWSPCPLLLLYVAYAYASSASGRSLLAKVVGANAVAVSDEKEAAVAEEEAVVALLADERLFAVPELSDATPRGVLRFLVDVALAPAAWLMDATLAAPGRDATLWRLAANGGACTVWLVGLSYGMVVALERIGALIGVSAAVVGITVGAAGTSFPNLVSSMVAARDGHANMAVSNALGSNTFNLCICLGLPWLLYPFVYGEPYEALHDYSVVVDVALLAFVLAVYVGVLVAYDYTLHAFMGYVFGLTWVAFLACSILLGREIDVVENHVQGGN